MRLGRLLIGLVLVPVTLWVIVGEQITGVSSDAVVNARLSTVRAPIAGHLNLPFLPFGTEMSAGEDFATLSAQLADTMRRDDLIMERAFVSAEISQISALLSASVTIDDAMPGRGSQTEPAPVEVAELSESSVMNDAATTPNSANLHSFGQEPGLVPLNVSLTTANRRLAAIDQRLQTEETRLVSQSQQKLTIPMDGVLWEVLASDGEYVERGQDIAKLMICGSALVTLSVPANIYARLVVGQSANFRLDGTTELFEGTITRMAGAGAETIYRNLAVAPSVKHLERYDVSLLVPELRKEPALRCAVGQSGRVFFDTRPLDWLRSILR